MVYQDLQFSKINETYQKTLMLLDKDIKVDGNRAGWHHFIGEQRIGNVATAQGILIHSYLNHPSRSLNELLITLRESQYRDDSSFNRGGWSFITSTQDTPTLEATAWALLGLLAGGEPSNSDSVIQGKDWIKRNQNLDGGWGSKKELCSRIYTTFIACRCLSMLEPNLFRENLQGTVRWVLSCQNARDGGWGPARGENSTAIHTAFALFTLHNLGLGITTEVERGIKYLYERWNPQTMWEHTQKLEQYDLPKDDMTLTRITFHYFPTAWIITTLLTIGENIFQEQLFLGTKWLIQSQNPDGSWSVSGVPKNRFWSIHDAILAITTFLNKAISTQTIDSMVMLNELFILTKNHKDFISLVRRTVIGILLLGAMIGAIMSSATELHLYVGQWVQKYWAWIFLAIYLVCAYISARLRIYTRNEVLIGLIIPVVMLVLSKYI